MPEIRPDEVSQNGTKGENGQSDMEIEQQKFLQDVYEKIAEAEKQIMQGAYLDDAETVLANLRTKYVQKKNVK